MQFLAKLTRFRFFCFDQSCFSQQAALAESWSVMDSFVYVIKSSLVSLYPTVVNVSFRKMG